MENRLYMRLKPALKWVPAWLKGTVEYAYWLQFVGIGWLALMTLTIVGCQAFVFLKHGFWVSLSVARMLANAGLPWARQPADWRGAFMVLETMPASLLFALVAALWFGLILLHAHRRERLT